MCGGDISADVNALIGTCDSCGVTSTLPKANDERIVNLFNRANHFRRHHEFDKALAAYESILTEDPVNAEAHWCVVLCRYGIEYVEDPKTYERVPTCHRTQFASILTDADYIAALENAPDTYTHGLYEEAAKRIHEIQRDILAVSNQEEPYDVFICYKESTDGGSRTKDSTLAQDIYYQLTKEGLRVFFAKITLEEKIGRQYEPYIFNALNTAKVMLVIGTKPEYLNAVWVKNEWSRYLALMKTDRSRLLIPCYRDMDAYEMPDELTAFQAMDMGKIGFIQDLVRGVKKVTGSEGATKTQAQTVVQTADVSGAVPLIKRAFISIEDKEFDKAQQLLDQALNIDPENAKAYVGLLLVEYGYTHEEQLNDCGEGLEERNLYQRALRFADAGYKRIIIGYDENSKRLVNERAETKRKRALLKEASRLCEYTDSLDEAIRILEGLQDFENAETELARCRERQEEEYERAVNLAQKEKYLDAITIFDQLKNYKDAPEQIRILSDRLREIKEQAQEEEYKRAVNLAQMEKYLDAINIFNQLKNYKDAPKQMRILSERLREIKKQAKILSIKKRNKLIIILASCAVLVTLIVMGGPYLYNMAAERVHIGALAKIRNSMKAAIETSGTNRPYILGLHENGTVTMTPITGDLLAKFVIISGWRDIVAIAAGSGHTVGLRSDGTVVSVGDNFYGQLNTNDWRDIVAIAAGSGHTVGLRSNGTVIAVGDNLHGQLNTNDWHDIVAITAGSIHTVGLKSDGTVITVGNNFHDQRNTTDWRGIVAITAGSTYTVGLRLDGTVIAVGNNLHVQGQLNTNGWRDIVAITAGPSHIVGLRADGTVVTTGGARNSSVNTNGWRDIVAIATGLDYVVGLRADGTVVTTGGLASNLHVGNWQLFDPR